MVMQSDVMATSSYQRMPIVSSSSASALCPAEMTLLSPFSSKSVGNDVCIQSDCPAQLSFQCGVVCMKNAISCSTTVAKLSLVLLKVVQAINAGNVPGAIILVKDVWQMVSAWPKCKNLSTSQAGIAEADFLVQLEKVMQGMH